MQFTCRKNQTESREENSNAVDEEDVDSEDDGSAPSDDELDNLKA